MLEDLLGHLEDAHGAGSEAVDLRIAEMEAVKAEMQVAVQRWHRKRATGEPHVPTR